MTINIFTDASVNPTTLNAAYAFYIGSRGVKVQRAGVLKTKTNSSNVAELHTIANALNSLYRLDLKGIQHVNIYSDSLSCVEALSCVGVIGKPLAREVRYVFNLCAMLCLRYDTDLLTPEKLFTFHKTKAHSKTTDKHSLINRWCDREAGRFRRWADKAPIYPNRPCPEINLQISLHK